MHSDAGAVVVVGVTAQLGRVAAEPVAQRTGDVGSALVEDNPLSVATGRSMEAIANARDRVWDSQKGEVAGDPQPEAKPAKKLTGTRPPGARKRAMPGNITPQLATLVDRPPDGSEWLHEIKYDGYRLLARIEKGKARLITRNGLDWTAKFPALERNMAALPVETALVDGELVALASGNVVVTTGSQQLLYLVGEALAVLTA